VVAVSLPLLAVLLVAGHGPLQHPVYAPHKQYIVIYEALIR
jgi:hypothetical protein